MMSAGSTAFQTAEDGNGGKQRTPCPLPGCKRVYTDQSSLDTHVKDHEIPAESLPGKVLLCSTVGCNGSFPSMQKLMEHMRHHHKPNIFFLCESCRTKLRSLKGLLTHLHTCSKVSKGKIKQPEPTAPPPPAVPNNPDETPVAMDQDPPRLESVSSSQQMPYQIPNQDASFSAAAPQLDTSIPPHLGPPFLPNQDPSPPHLAPQQLTEAAPQPQIMNHPSSLPPSLNLDGAAAAAPDLPDVRCQQQASSGSVESFNTPQGPAPQSPPPSAVWKKNQGLSCSRRVLWEHTRGRYTCVQCGFTATNRKEITQHINTQHSGSKAAEDAGSSAATKS